MLQGGGSIINTLNSVNLQLNAMYSKVIAFKACHCLFILPHFAIARALGVIPFYMVEMLHNRAPLLAPPSNSFSDVRLAARSQLWWEYLHHGNGWMLQISP